MACQQCREMIEVTRVAALATSLGTSYRDFHHATRLASGHKHDTPSTMKVSQWQRACQASTWVMLLTSNQVRRMPKPRAFPHHNLASTLSSI